MELRIGSNIMIHFLYILLLLIWHMYLYVYYTLLVVIIIYYFIINVLSTTKGYLRMTTERQTDRD